MLKSNILANYVGTAVGVLAPIVALPWYLATLGGMQFGLVSVVLLVQALLGLLEAGLGQALVRQFAAGSQNAEAGGANGLASAASLLRVFERIYWVFAGIAGLLTLLFAPLIASHWLNLDGGDPGLGVVAVIGAGLIFAVQFPGLVYRSALVGLQRQVQLNVTVTCSAVARHGGGVALLLTWPGLFTYLAWNASISLVETLVRSHMAWRLVQARRRQTPWDWAAWHSSWRWAMGLSGAAWLGALTVQMDKIFLSHMASVEQLGYYSIAATIAGGALQAVYPLVQAVLPRAVQLRENPRALHQLNTKLAFIIGSMVLVGILAFAQGGFWLLERWLKDPLALAAVYPVLCVLLVGTVLNAFYNIGYINWIVHEKIHRVIQVNAVSLVLAVILIPIMVSKFGVTGAAMGWIAINLVGFVMSLGWLKKPAT